MTTISVTKCHGTGNDFIIVDGRAALDLPYAQIARALCARRFAVGADGLLVLADPRERGADAGMRIFNPDGSEAEMCGNGIRCIARYLYEENPEATESVIETVAGRMQTTMVTWQERPGVRVAMGEPVLLGSAGGRLDRALPISGERAPAYGVTIGNPHIVVFTSHDPADCDLVSLATMAASWKVFAGEPNLEIAQVAGEQIAMRVHERGVGETWACGTGACATAAAAIASQRASSPVTVTTRGGSVRVSWDGPGHPAFLTGNAELVFRADVEVEVTPNVSVTTASAHR